ncbi:conserved hypothetical protein [Nitrosotalea sinensis]|uniref:Uncharacterized protein n=1 Tax=Nitrosotalea sinensis TaxID=1499975 RepID=A0A2H1EH19_9ARCH|nr:hypothetical protein [Candidatus Nitrosotalea sinensis]SHO46005.1 conserved hypothetical protein [Candidatus Nitrosotalea sinensis]
MENEDVLISMAGMTGLAGMLAVGDKQYQVQSMSIAKSTIPVRKPTTRGGVYFTDTTAYKIKASTHDLSIIPEMPKLMLGPNTDFMPILLKTTVLLSGKENQVTLVTHLTNAVNTKEKVELNLIVDKVDLK